MPSKSSTSKPVKRAAPRDGGVQADAQKTSIPGKVLSLIEEPAPKKKRGAPPAISTVLPPLGMRPAPKKIVAPAPVLPPRKTLDEEKAGALSLFEEQEIKAARRAEKKNDSTPPAAPAKAPQMFTRPPISGPVAVTESPLVAIKPVEPAPVPAAVPEDEETGDPKIIHIKPPIFVKDLADRMGLKPFKIIGDLIKFQVFAKADTAIEPDVASKVCELHGFIFEKEKREKGAGHHKVEENIEPPPAPLVEEEPKDKLELRAPIITFMGHVDHGKTSLLDAIRKTAVTSDEAGGITQHLGAYSVTHNGRPITFIDTPGHAAFSEMRARGAGVTDIVVIIIAADDGIMPQTIEAINHAKAAGVTLMVAINKIDMPGANVMRVKQQLQGMGLMPVEWGGETEIMEVSATKGIGIDNFLETMSLQAEVLELHANPNAPARAIVIESRMDAGRGPNASVIVETGTLKAGQPFICGRYSGKVKSLINDRGQQIKEVRPGMPAEVIGFSGLPNVGDELVVVESERAAKKLSEERLEELRQKKLSVPRRSSLENLFSNIEHGTKKSLNIVLKTDVQGSLEALTRSLQEIVSGKIELKILHGASGPISESDILLASASDAIVVGFNVKLESTAVSVAKREAVQVKLFSIIYELLDQVKEAMLGRLDPETREKVIGHAKVKMVFKLTRGKVAGCVVIDGRMDRKGRARVLRGTQSVYDGSMDTLRRFQDEVPEVRNGLECGIRLGGYTDYEEEDVIECYELEKLAVTL